MKCLHCNGLGEIEHPAWRELERLWLKGWLTDEEAITDFSKASRSEKKNPCSRRGKKEE